MLVRLWKLIQHRIAAKLYLLTGISLAALAVLAAVSIHFANQTKSAAGRLYQEGVLGVRNVTQLEVLFEQHRALIKAAPAELDRFHLQKSRQSVDELNSRIATILAKRTPWNERFLAQIEAEVPGLTQWGYRVLRLAENFSQDEALAVSQGSYSAAAQIIADVLKDWNQEQIGAVGRETTRLTKAAQDLNWWVIAAALTAFVLIGPVTLWAMHRIMSRLGKLTAVMHRLCNNELTVEVPYTKSFDEMGDIARSIDVFKTNATALKQAHVQLDIALNNMSQGLCFFDGAQRLIVCNNIYSEIYGIAPGCIRPGTTLEEIVGLRFEAGSSPATSKEDYLAWRQTLVEADKPSDTITELKNGRAIRIRHQPMADHGWVATHEDITEQRRREASFRLLFDSNPVAMLVYDRETFCYLAVNDAAVAQYGYSREQFLTMTVPDIRATQDEGFKAFLRALPESQNGEHVAQHQRADGTKIYVQMFSRSFNYENRSARLVAAQDITERKLAEDDLRHTQMFLDAVIESVPLPIVVKTAKESRFTLINKAAEELFGISRGDMVGKTPRDIYDREHADLVLAGDREALLADQPFMTPDHSVNSPGHGIRLVTSKKVAIRDGKQEYLLTVIDDVTERRQSEQRIAHMAHSDTLTDLPNRASFNECLSTTLKLAKEKAGSFAILCMDLDGFKEVNDVYGHAVGDALLCQVADRLRASGDGVFIARLGGDEFTIIADNHVRSGVVRLIDRLLAAFAGDFEVDGHRLRQALSIGVAIYPADGTDTKTLMNNADAALYRAKAGGSGSVQFFEPEMAEHLRKRAALQADLRLALQRKELRLHYQPQLTMAGEITGFEALARWYSPKRGVVPPGEFIPLAEESSLILLMGEWVLREACREAVSWDKPLKVAVNVSPIQFRHGDLTGLVHSVLLETGLTAGRLELEITEGVLIDDFSRAVSILRRLKLLGVQIALDDFGTGYSSLSYLHAFPFDKIKIDRTFISDLETNRHSIAIVRAVIGLSRSLNIPILAEGVETEGQHAFLAKEGCDEVQGYLTGRPREISEYANLIRQKRLARRILTRFDN